MRYYIVKNAQALGQGDPGLTDLGRIQAARLGDYMQHLGFSGKIYASPRARTMETARIIGSKTGSKVIPWEPLITPEGLQPALESLGLQEDTLFLCHRSTAQALIDIVNVPKKNGELYDCAFSMVNTADRTEFRYKDVAHLPNAMISDGAWMLIDQQRKRVEKRMAQGIHIPEELENASSLRLLHIGDTESVAYPYYAELIRRVRPDIIIHTGDAVDEVKAGRMINTEEEYEAGLRVLADILKNSGAKEIYIVPGNNDIPELLKKHLPFAKYTQPDTQITVAGITCTLGHAWFEATKESRWSFYGHGLTGEVWRPEMNADLQNTCRFNVIWGPTVLLPEEQKQFHFDAP